jgi:hypothetical protein
MAPILDETTPLGSGEYVVSDGDCMSSIAEKSGHFWPTLWDLAANKAVRDARADPNVLLPGDRLTVPPIEPKSVAAVSGAKHVFRRRGVPVFLRVRFLDAGGEPRKGLGYKVRVADMEWSGTLDDKGWLVQAVPPGATEAVVELANGMATTLRIGSLDPLRTLDGVRARLENLGYLGANIEESGLRTALENFQSDHDLPVTGLADEATRQALSVGFGA